MSWLNSINQVSDEIKELNSTRTQAESNRRRRAVAAKERAIGMRHMVKRILKEVGRTKEFHGAKRKFTITNPTSNFIDPDYSKWELSWRISSTGGTDNSVRLQISIDVHGDGRTRFSGRYIVPGRLPKHKPLLASDGATERDLQDLILRLFQVGLDN